jgi:hypothetical protein
MKLFLCKMANVSNYIKRNYISEACPSGKTINTTVTDLLSQQFDDATSLQEFPPISEIM